MDFFRWKMINQSNTMITSNLKCKVREAGRERRTNVHIMQGYWGVMGRVKHSLWAKKRENFTGKEALSVEVIRWPTTMISPKTIVTKPKQKDRLHQLVLPPKTPQVYLHLQVCCLYNCPWRYLSASPVLVALGVPANLFMPMGPSLQRKTSKALVWRAETLTDFWQYELKCIFSFVSFCVFHGGRKKKKRDKYSFLVIAG